MTPQQPDKDGAVLAIDQAMIALAVAKSALLGETSAPIPLASLRDRGHYDAGSAAEVAEGVHGWLDPLPDELPEGVAPFPHFPHLSQHTNGSRACGLCGIDHDAAARLAPPVPYALPAASIPADGA